MGAVTSMDAAHEILCRIASELPDDSAPLDRQDELAAGSLIPPSLIVRLRGAFTVRGMPFFDFYPMLKRIELGEPASPDLKRDYATVVTRLIQITSPVDNAPLSPAIVNLLVESRTEIGLYLGRLAAGNTNDNLTWAKINNTLVPLIEAVARDKGIYLMARQLGTRRWAQFRRMGVRQERAEMVRDENPEAYVAITKHNKTLAEISQGIKDTIIRHGLKPRETFLAGRTVMVGENPTTGEKTVYDVDGSILTVKEFLDRRSAVNKSNQILSQAHNRTTISVADVRTVNDEELERLTGPIEMVAVTDDKVKQSRMTRIFPCRRMPLTIRDPLRPHVTAVKVIIQGRFKGCLVDDVVNEAGRMVEGTAYSFDPATLGARPMPKKMDTRNREPYVSVGTPSDIRVMPDGETLETNKDRLYVRIPNTHAWTELRDAMKTLACNSVGNYSKRGCIPSIEWVPLTESRAAGFFFDPKDFGIIMDTLKGMALSTEALAMVKGYYKDLSLAEEATATANLGNYTAEAIGGFKTGLRRKDGTLRPIRLSTKQKQALAWLDANGNKGVCGLDTGTGKTLTAIAVMQKLERDGLTEVGATYKKPDGTEVTTNGRFLYVCPKSLKGNLTKEMRTFLTDAGLLIDRTDRMTYREFNNSMKSKMWRKKPWDPQAYVAVFFDEAQEMLSTSKSNPMAKAEQALALWHPRKIILTASPIDSDPMEAYLLAAICNNMPLRDGSPVAARNAMQMRKFRERFCETAGGRIIGVKDDPNTKRDLATWVKRNVFFADKQDVDVAAGETALPPLRDGTHAVTMDPAVEVVYRTMAKQMAAGLGAMVRAFRDRDGGYGKITDATKEMEALMWAPKFEPILRLLDGLSNYPDVTMREIADMIETGEYTTAAGKRGPIPSTLAPIVKAWAKKLHPKDLRVVAQRVGNPKLTTTAEIIKKRLARDKAGQTRTLLFADDRKLCWASVQHLATTVAGMHAIALDDAIHIFDGGQPLKEWTFRMDPDAVVKIFGGDKGAADNYMKTNGGVARIPLPFKKKSYRRYMGLPVTADNVKYGVEDWQTFALAEIISKEGQIKTLTLLGNSYKFGQNLQAFDTVIHLDRDTWNAEAMKQRTARAWRQGQDRAVTEITVDTVYEDAGGDERDATIDQIRRYFQEMSSDLFDLIIKGAQGAALGAEWRGVTKEQASTMRIDRKMFELAMSPYAGRSVPPQAG